MNQSHQKSRNQVYSKDMNPSNETNNKIMLQNSSRSQNQSLSSSVHQASQNGEKNSIDSSKWSSMLKSMIADSWETEKNTEYYAAIQAKMYKNLKEREIEFGSHQEIITFAFDGGLLAASSTNGLIYAYQVSDESVELLGQIMGHFTEIDSIEVAKQGSVVFSSSKNRSLMVSWRVQGAVSGSKRFKCLNLDQHFQDKISFMELAWMEQLSTLVALDYAGNVKFIQLDQNCQNLKQINNLEDIHPETAKQAVAKVRVSRNGLKVAYIDARSEKNSITVLRLNKGSVVGLEGSETISVGSAVSDFSLSKNGDLIAVRVESGETLVWRSSEGGERYQKITPTALDTPGASAAPQISLSAQGSYLAVSDSKSQKVSILSSTEVLAGGQDADKGYRPSLELETKLGLQKIQIIDNERFVACLFNHNSIKLFSIMSEEELEDGQGFSQNLGLRARSSSLLGVKRYQQVTKFFDNKEVLYIEKSWDGGKTLFVTKEAGDGSNDGVGGGKEGHSRELSLKTPNQSNILEKSSDGQQGSGCDAKLSVTVWNTSKMKKTNQALISSFEIPLQKFGGGGRGSNKISLEGIGDAPRFSPHLDINSLYRFRGVLVNLNHRDHDFYFRASRDLGTILLGSEEHIHIWEDYGSSYKLVNSAPLNTGIKIDSMKFLGEHKGFLVGGRDNELRVYSATGQLMQEVDAHSLRVSACASSSSGDLVVTGSLDRSLRIWGRNRDQKSSNASKYELKEDFEMVHRSNVTAIAISEDSKLLITSSETEVYLFAKKELSDGYFQVQAMEDEAFSQIFISGDGRYVLTRAFSEPGESSEAKIWQIINNKIYLLYSIGEFELLASSSSNFRDVFFIHKPKMDNQGPEGTEGGQAKQIRMKNLKSGAPNNLNTNIDLLKLRVTHKIENNFEMDKKILNLFKNRTELIDPDHLTNLIHHVEEVDLPNSQKSAKIQNLENSPGLAKFNTDIIIHGRVNLLLLAVIARNPEPLEEVIEKYGYQPFFYQEGFDPFEVAMQINDNVCLERITDYLEQNESKKQYFVTHENFIRAMKTSNIRLKQLFVESFMTEPLALECAKVQPILQFPLGMYLYDATFCNSNYYEQDLKDSIENTIQSYSRLRDDKSNMSEIRLLVTRFKIKSSLFNNGGYELLKAINKVQDDLITSDIKYLIRHFWWSNYITITLLALLQCSGLISFVVMVLREDMETPVGILAIFINLLLLVFEFLVMGRGVKIYFSQLNNIMDLYQYICIPIVCICFIGTEINQGDIVFNLWTNLTMIIAGFRVLFALRIIEPVRYLVIMILQALIDMTGFMIISIATIVIFATMQMNLTKTVEDDPDLSPAAYRRSLNAVYEIAFGSWEDSSEYNASQYVVHLVNTVFITLVMANLLIGIISQTFADFVEKKELVDFREMLSILLDVGDLISYFTSRKKDEMDEKGRKFICFVVRKEDEGDNQEVLDEIEAVKEQNEEIKAQNEAILGRIAGIEELIGKGVIGG